MSSSSLQEWSEQFGLPILTNLLEMEHVARRTPLLPYAFVKKRGLLPLQEEQGKVLVALSDPLDLEALQDLRQALGKEIIEGLASLQEIESAIEYCYHKEEGASDLMASLQNAASSRREDDLEGYDLLDSSAESPAIKLLNAILLEAIQQGSSDIHFEPLEQGLGVRYRIDGVLQERHAPPKEYQSQLITRIKVLAKLDIAEHRLPQDGRMKLRMGGRHIDFRVSTVPCVFGERIVLRILDKSNVLLGLSKIGMREDLLQIFSSLIHYPEGIVLVTGPTGSGKTTTLYSALAEINSPQVNIMTIEDPVEYKLQGLAQIGVNPKIHLHFATGLRHILRQDPDIIMVGEIRDRETAEIAIQAALTGHLVLSTLHTNDAPSALTRLVDMGVAPYLLTSSVIGIVAQRLVRTLCKHCKEPYTPSEQEALSLRLSQEQPLLFYKARGCDTCFHSGYKGRRGIYELLPLTQTIKQQLLQSADAHQLQKTAKNLGMRTLLEEGAELVAKGITSSEEILRVTRNCEEL
ncbi:MAG: type II secretion system protein GspE [Chlamydiae bacterium]|nr:type II secretion system protein GspE [Chlamydiota bacterium]